MEMRLVRLGGRVFASRTIITFKEPRLLPFSNFLGEVRGAAQTPR